MVFRSPNTTAVKILEDSGILAHLKLCSHLFLDKINAVTSLLGNRVTFLPQFVLLRVPVHSMCNCPGLIDTPPYKCRALSAKLQQLPSFAKHRLTFHPPRASWCIVGRQPALVRLQEGSEVSLSSFLYPSAR